MKITLEGGIYGLLTRVRTPSPWGMRLHGCRQ